MISNFNTESDYFVKLLQARKSKKFKALDDKVRNLAYELGKGNKTVDKKEYETLLQQRNQEFEKFYQDTKTEDDVTNKNDAKKIDHTLYRKIDAVITTKLDSFIAKFPNTKLKNIVLLGATGTGKTYCAKIIQNELQQKNFKVYFSTTFNLVKRMKDYLFGQDPDVPDDFFNSDLLIIDDLGAEPSIKNSDEYLYTVVNERYSSDKSFIITSNLSKEQILNRYDQRLYGRIFDKKRTADILLNGKDLRIE